MEHGLLLDEVFYPLEKIHLPLSKGEKGAQMSMVNQLYKLKRDYGHVDPALQKLSIYTIPATVKGATYNKTDMCQNTADARDFFRVFSSSTDRSKQYILTPLKTGDGVKRDPCQDRCFHTDRKLHDACRARVHELYEGSGIGIEHKAPSRRCIDDVLVYEWQSRFDSLGNLLVCPPTKLRPTGTILYGNATPDAKMNLEFTWTPVCQPRDDGIVDPFCTTEQTIHLNSVHSTRDGENEITDISPALRHILDTNFSSQHVASVYTGWLEVGHIDEIISFVKHPDGEFGFKMLINSPSLFLSMWSAASDRIGCLFDTTLESGGDQLLGMRSEADENCPHSGFALPSVDDCTIRLAQFADAELSNLIRFNSFLQSVLDTIEQSLCRELGLRSSDVIKIPILFTGPDELYAPAIVQQAEEWGMTVESFHREVFRTRIGGVYHLSSNLVNSVISPTFMICDDPHSILPIDEHLRDTIIRRGGIEAIYFVDTWDSIKYQHGGIHCFTGETRDLTRPVDDAWQPSPVSASTQTPRHAARSPRHAARSPRRLKGRNLDR